MTDRVVVAGAGPVGLTGALVLAMGGVPVTVLEAAAGLSTASKASTFHPSTLDLLQDLGVGDALVAAGRKVERIQWRNLRQDTLCGLDYSLLAEATAHPYRVHVEQSRLTPLLLARLAEYPHAEVLFSAEVVDARDNGETVTVRVDEPGGVLRKLEARYLLAADGSRSRVRRAVGLPDEARDYASYALRVITDTELDTLLPGLSPLTYVRDVRQSFSVLGMPDHWRLIFRIPHRVPRDEAVRPENVQDLLARGLPSAHRRIHVVTAHTYRLASFVLPRYRLGRIVFAGDAAHLTSTAGGMNMNCGLHDAVAWGRVLTDLTRRQHDEHALEEVARERRSAALNAAIPRSEARTAGLSDGEALARALAEVRRVASDPALATDYLVKASLLDCAPRPQPVG